MELSAFKEKLRASDISGWYIFAGEEDYLKKHYLSQLRGAIISDDDPFRLFNHVVYDGQNIDYASLAEAIKAPPMMGEYKLIEWKFASFENMKESEKKALESIFSLKEEYPYAVFAIMTTEDGFDTGTPNRRSKLYNFFSEAFDIISFPKSTDSQLILWLKRHFDAEGIGADAETLSAMLFRVGRSMEVLNSEVEKLASFAKANGKTKIDFTDVEEVTCATLECDAFALSNAVTEKNLGKALAALADLKARRIEAYTVIAMLERSYAELLSVALLLSEGKGSRDIETLLKLHPFKAKLAIGAAKRLGTKKISLSLDAIRKLDAASKSGGVGGYLAVEMFITQNL